MNKIRFIQTDMRALWFIHPSGIKKYYPSPASYQRLERAKKSMGWQERHFDYYQGLIEPIPA